MDFVAAVVIVLALAVPAGMESLRDSLPARG
jgi:hypothetical protein